MAILGIDIGGTSIKGGLVNEKGELGKTFSVPIDKKLSQEEQIDKMIEEINKVYLSNEFKGIGLGIPGTIDTKEGVVRYSNNLVWNELPIVEILNKSFPGKEIAINNDANVAALGELKFGAGKKEENIILITLGTGVGSGIIIDGKLFDGKNGRGAEIGHQVIEMDGVKCTCGRKGCFEMYASATALIRQTKEAIKNNPNSLLSKETLGKDINAKTVFDIAKKGCEVANEVVNNYVKYLSEGLLNICNIFRPSSIILSGGVANQKDYLVDKVKDYLSKFNYGFGPRFEVDIKCSELGYNSGIIGAASLLLK